jgi:hypothetical protein
MEAYELHFNPKTKKELAFETFCFEPETAQEKKLGSLYLAGLINGEDEAGLEIIFELAALIKTQYYRPENTNAETAFKEVLKQANGLLAGINLKESSSISFFALSSKENELNFSQFGNAVKAVFYQKGKISEMDGNTKNKNPAFKNIVSGKLGMNDSMMILSSDVLDFFSEKKLLEKMTLEKESKGIQKALDKFKKETGSLSGFCLFLRSRQADLSKKIKLNGAEGKKLLPFLSGLEKISSKISLPSFSLPANRWRRFSLPGIADLNPAIAKLLKNKTLSLKENFGQLPRWSGRRRKDIASVAFLVLIFLAGFFMSQAEKKKELDAALKEIKQVEQMASRADLLAKQYKDQEANLLLQEALNRISLEIKKSQAAGREAETLENKIREKLYAINKFESNTPFETVLELSKNKTTLIPNNILYQNEKFYLFNSVSGKLLVYDIKDRSGETFSSRNNLAFGKVFGKDQIIFIDSQNQIVLFRGDNFQTLGLIAFPYPGTELQSFETFKSNLYLLGYDLDSKEFPKEIIKYGYLGNFKWEGPQTWLEKTPKDTVSIAADGLLWLLNSGGSIKSYYGGQFQNEISLKIFPYLKSISKILAPSTLSNLYLLEPGQKRIIILDKNGEILKQLQNDQWTNLLDFAVAPDGKTIYLLNENSILKVGL